MNSVQIGSAAWAPVRPSGRSSSRPTHTTASRSAVKLSVYGRIPAQQNAWLGVYHDAVTVTVSY